MSVILVAAGLALAFGLSACATLILTCQPKFLTVLDQPNERSLHSTPIPRTGGVAIFLAIVVAGGVVLGVYESESWIPVIALSLTLVAGVSFLDDRSHVSPAVRLLVQFVAVALLVFQGLSFERMVLPGLTWQIGALTGSALAVLYMLWMTNLYNFMDGMDGLAAGMAVIGFAALGMLAVFGGHLPLAAASGVVAAAAGGFLVFNFPPARIFMGDIGSSVLGFLAGAISLWADKERVFPLWAAVLVFSPFIVDATVTLCRRLAAGARIWEAHRSHYYQRTVTAGWGHKKTVVAEYVLMIACAISALIAVPAAPAVQWTVIASWLVMYVYLALQVERFTALGEVGERRNK